jgi:putative FmdB family regulatory protein
MPIYEYECKQCHREFEYQQRMADPEKTVCENCGGALARIISRTAFQLKGGGWYKDLYGSPKPEGAGGGNTGLAPGLAPPIGAHEGPPTGAEINGRSITSDGRSADQIRAASEEAKSKAKTSEPLKSSAAPAPAAAPAPSTPSTPSGGSSSGSGGGGTGGTGGTST